MLSNAQKKELRSLAHHEPAYVQIGKNGLNENLVRSFQLSLEAHNLVKVSLMKHTPVSKQEVIDALIEETGCELISSVGRVLVFYKFHEEGRIQI